MLTNDGAEVTMGGASDPTSTSQHSVRVRLLCRTQILLTKRWNVLWERSKHSQPNKTLHACECVRAPVRFT